MKLFTLFCLWFAVMATAQSQLKVVRLSGGSETLPIQDITKITFTASDMVVGGVNKTYPISDIRVLLFTDIAVRTEPGAMQAPSVMIEGASPNPFNPGTTLRFALVTQSNVRITVINSSGRRIKDLLNASLKPGSYRVGWNGEDGQDRKSASGAYLLRISVNGQAVYKKAVFLK